MPRHFVSLICIFDILRCYHFGLCVCVAALSYLTRQTTSNRIGNFCQSQYEFLQLSHRCSIEINWHYFFAQPEQNFIFIFDVVIKIVVEIVSFAFRISNFQAIEAISNSFLFGMLFHCLTFIAKMTSFALDLNKITSDKFRFFFIFLSPLFCIQLNSFQFQIRLNEKPILAKGNDLLPLSHSCEWWKLHINHNTV